MPKTTLKKIADDANRYSIQLQKPQGTGSRCPYRGAGSTGQEFEKEDSGFREEAVISNGNPCSVNALPRTPSEAVGP